LIVTQNGARAPGLSIHVYFVTCLFNVLYNNNILLLQMKYRLNGQQVTEVEPVLHSHATAQATNCQCGGPAQCQTSRRRMCDGTSRTEKGFLPFAAFSVIPPLFHVHLFIYLSLTVCNSSHLHRC
jgi:hypothetical protein